MENGFPHPVDILLPLVFALPQVYGCYHLGPALLPLQLVILLTQLILLLLVLFGSLSLLLLLLGDKVFELFSALGNSFALLLPLFLLNEAMVTLLSLSALSSLSSSWRILLVVSSCSN